MPPFTPASGSVHKTPRRAAFADAALEQEFRATGYLRIPLLDGDAVVQARDLHASLIPHGEGGIKFDSVRDDRSVIRTMTERVEPLVRDALDDVLVRHRLIFVACVVKHPGDASGMEPHDDRSFVDERQWRSLTMWVPLVDCDVEPDRGTIAILPHSEDIEQRFGGSNTATWYGPYRRFIAEHMTPVPARAGEAVVWDSRAVHGSGPNRSAVARPALLLVVAPSDAPLVHAVGLSRDRVELLSVDRDFHLDHSPLAVRIARPPGYETSEIVDETGPRVSVSDVAALCGSEVLPVAEASRPREDWFAKSVGQSPIPIDDGHLSVERAELERLCEWAQRAASSVDWESIPRRVGLEDARGDARVAPVGSIPSSPDGGDLSLSGTGARVLCDLSLVRLGAGAAFDGRAGHGRLPRLVLPLATPPGGGGIATRDLVTPFELGRAVLASGTERSQVFNDGPDPLFLVTCRISRWHRILRRRLEGAHRQEPPLP